MYEYPDFLWNKTDTWILVVVFIVVVWVCMRREKAKPMKDKVETFARRRKGIFTRRRRVEHFTREDDLVRGLLRGQVRG